MALPELQVHKVFLDQLGPSRTNGFNGNNGNNGLNGAQGVAGSTGDADPQGSAGVPGVQQGNKALQGRKARLAATELPVPRVRRVRKGLPVLKDQQGPMVL